MARATPEDYVFLDDQMRGTQRVFTRPSHIISAHSRADLPAAFQAIDAAQAKGQWLAGWLSYELGYALEPKFPAPARDTPLLQLGVFNAPSDHAPIDWLYTRDIPDLVFKPDWTEAEYLARFEKLQNYIQEGDCYQVNLTFPMRAQSDVTPAQLYAAFRRRQPGRHGGVVSLGETDIISFSPELFFERSGKNMRMRPMKGTRPRGQTDDAAIAAAMQAEPKSRAENLMIVDLLRNDLSRLCAAGSVKVPELFTLETYPTLHQMTSEVTGELRSDIHWGDIFRGLFPCGSVTGAPKIRAMEIIRDLETGPRGAYCGSLGYIAPNGDASFSVAIRTVQMHGGALRYDVGSGVVADSDGPDEYRECLLKAHILAPQAETAIETFRRLPSGDIPRLDTHLARAATAMSVDEAQVTQRLKSLTKIDGDQDLRVRLEFSENPSNVSVITTPYAPLPTPLRLALSRYPLGPNVQNMRYKSSRRDFYDGERARLAAQLGVDEVVFANVSGAICEGSFTSLFVKLDGAWLTPPLTEGILPGVLRAHLIAGGDITERQLCIDDLRRAEAVQVGNALRGRLDAVFIDYLTH